MKKRSKTIFNLLVAVCSITAISCNNDVLEEKTNKVDLSQIEFSLTDADFQTEDDNASTRSLKETVKDTVSLGDEMTAEVTVEPDTAVTKSPKTRAISNGHYTMLAYDMGGNLKGVLEGSVSGSIFTPASGKPDNIQLTPGTYTFVCYNDKVTRNGNDLTVAIADAETARIGKAENVVVSGKKQKIPFVMKHAGCKVRFQYYIPALEIYQSEDVKASVSSDIGSVPTTVTMNAFATNVSYSSGTITGIPLSVSYKTQEGYNTVSGCIGGSGEVYMLPSTNSSNFTLNFKSGQIWETEFTGKSIKVPTSKVMKMNGSYVVKFKIFTKPYYLFSDGTAGLIAKHPGKTPIGLVVYRPMHLAMALKDADAGTTYQWNSLIGAINNNDERYSSEHPDDVYSLLTEPSTGSDPGDYTISYQGFMTPSTSEVKANSTNFPAFYTAAHYTPGVPVTGTNINHWFLPTVYSWRHLLQHYGKKISTIYDFLSWTDQLDYSSSSIASLFTSVGGTAPTGMYWTGREYEDTSSGTPQYYGVSMFLDNNKVSIWKSDKWDLKKVRPFIYY